MVAASPVSSPTGAPSPRRIRQKYLHGAPGSSSTVFTLPLGIPRSGDADLQKVLAQLEETKQHAWSLGRCMFTWCNIFEEKAERVQLRQLVERSDTPLPPRSSRSSFSCTLFFVSCLLGLYIVPSIFSYLGEPLIRSQMQYSGMLPSRFKTGFGEMRLPDTNLTVRLRPVNLNDTEADLWLQRALNSSLSGIRVSVKKHGLCEPQKVVEDINLVKTPSIFRDTYLRVEYSMPRDSVDVPHSLPFCQDATSKGNRMVALQWQAEVTLPDSPHGIELGFGLRHVPVLPQWERWRRQATEWQTFAEEGLTYSCPSAVYFKNTSRSRITFKARRHAALVHNLDPLQEVTSRTENVEWLSLAASDTEHQLSCAKPTSGNGPVTFDVYMVLDLGIVYTYSVEFPSLMKVLATIGGGWSFLVAGVGFAFKTYMDWKYLKRGKFRSRHGSDDTDTEEAADEDAKRLPKRWRKSTQKEQEEVSTDTRDEPSTSSPASRISSPANVLRTVSSPRGSDAA
eukprot:TRINITY_DN4025_c0_g1_i11.p1 TRINITY_DN4025_c0_g1~~TRINITY_DN4025_c0_g1_i11.p1  ORF type:complete len:509 (-),score=74.44 TRINITY_DN4025_c0_g1_i11:189-1715(-)